MKNLFASIVIVGGLLIAFDPFAGSNQADDTTIRINGYTPGVTPFISKLSLTASNTAVLKSIQFTITPKPGFVSRPLSGTYANYYLVGRAFENPQTGEIVLPVYGLYDGYTNIVTLTYHFMDGSSKQANIGITTATFNDPCGYKNPIFLQHRTSTALSYDYLLVKGGCSNFSPAIVDTDGALRWVGTAGFSSITTGFFDNGFYLPHDGKLYRIDLDGAVTQIADYNDRGFYFHHNIDLGKFGLLLEINTSSYYESMVMEVDAHSGNVLKTWDLATIISAAMRAGGDDPSQFVYPAPSDWVHNNSVAYNRADDSLIVSSRENFLICFDYATGAIKWILGDPTKKWYQFPSLRRYALTLAPGSLPPIGQHAVSVTFDQNILVLDNGENSRTQQPPGVQRGFASPRKYKLDLNAKVATEVWNHEIDQAIDSPLCSSVYEDAPLNYLIGYSIVGGLSAQNQYAQLLGLNAAGETIFYFQYTADFCTTAFNAIPVHLENTKFPTVGPRVQNLSTRGTVSSGDNVLINGFIITGSDPTTVVLRALGPSLSGFGLSGVLADPILSVYNSSGVVIATNDNWQTDPGSAFMAQTGFAPSNPAESAALVTNLAQGAYTVVVRGQNSTQGISLAEVYEIYGPGLNSKLGNVSGRSFVDTGDNVLISGFIIGDVERATVVVRALGPSLGSFGVSQPLSDPVLTIYDSKGSAIATNNNWQDDNNAILIQRNGLAPPNALDSALVLHLPAGNYTAVVRGASGATGNALVEVYGLD
jgi:arylsulfate sulfotransferase